MRADMIVNSENIDFKQTCTMILSLSAKRFERQSRYDYNVIVNYNENFFPAIIDSIICTSFLQKKETKKTLFVKVLLFQASAHICSQEMANISPLFYYKTISKHFATAVLPLSAVIHKCNVYKESENKWVWFY